MSGGCLSAASCFSVPTSCVLGCTWGMYVCVRVHMCVCPSAPALFPKALEGAVSLSGLAWLSSSYATIQVREPGWRPDSRGGMGSKGFPKFSVLVAQAIRQGMYQEGQPGIYLKLFPDQLPPGYLEWRPLGLGQRWEQTAPATAPPSGRKKGVKY